MALPSAFRISGRTVLALTCRKCGQLAPGSAFGRHARKLTDPRTYIDRRCTNCKWGAKRK